MKGDDLDRRPEFAAFVKQHVKICFAFSPDAFMDEQALPPAEAVNRAAMCNDAVIITGSSFVIVFTEPIKGGRDKYLLSGE